MSQAVPARFHHRSNFAQRRFDLPFLWRICFTWNWRWLIRLDFEPFFPEPLRITKIDLKIVIPLPDSLAIKALYLDAALSFPGIPLPQHPAAVCAIPSSPASS